MSIFDIDWNNDGKIDFDDTIFDLALIDSFDDKDDETDDTKAKNLSSLKT